MENQQKTSCNHVWVWANLVFWFQGYWYCKNCRETIDSEN